MVGNALGPVVLDVKGLVLDDAEREMLSQPMVGGLILFSRNFQNPAQLRELVADVRQVRPELVIAVDQEGGRVQRLREGFTRLPPMQQLGRLWDADRSAARELTRDCGWLMASEVLGVGIDMSFAPVLDVDDNHSSIIGDRSFSRAPEVVIEAAGAFMEGMHDAGMATTGKHFPGHGSVRADSHLELPVDERSLDEVTRHDMRPFRELCHVMDAVMPAHILFPQIDHELVGFSSWWLQEQLRGQLQFSGVVFSDDLSMAGAAAGGDYRERAEKALRAGCDAILVCNNPEEAENVVHHLDRTGASLSTRLPTMRARKEALPLGDLQATEQYDKVRKALESLV